MKNKKDLDLGINDLSSIPPSKKIVGVIGGNTVETDIRNFSIKLGREIGRNGYILVCGGLGGVMEAACRGAREAEQKRSCRSPDSNPP